jgi:hypothetical protein
MASSSEMVTVPGFCARVCAGGRRSLRRRRLRAHNFKTRPHRQQKRETQTSKAHGRTAFVSRRYKDGSAASGTKARRLLCGRGARRNVPRGVFYGEAEILRFGSRSCGQQDEGASAHRRRLDGLMAQMTDRAIVRRGSGVVMPDEAERCPYQERKERYRQHQPRNCRLTRHVLSSVSRPCARVGPV